MAQIIKRPFRSFNGTDWDEHYFKTSADQVVEDTSHKFCTQVEKDNYYNAYVDPVKVTFTFDSTYLVARDYSYILKKNGFVYAHLDAAKRSGASSNWWIKVGILPVGYRPLGTLYVPAILNTPNYKVTLVKVNTSGVIEVLNEDNSDEKVTLDLLFFVGGGTV